VIQTLLKLGKIHSLDKIQSDGQGSLLGDHLALWVTLAPS